MDHFRSSLRTQLAAIIYNDNIYYELYHRFVHKYGKGTLIPCVYADHNDTSKFVDHSSSSEVHVNHFHIQYTETNNKEEHIL